VDGPSRVLGRRLRLLACAACAACGDAGGLYFLPGEADYYRTDRVIGHVHQPNAERRLRWDEHPEGRIVLRTNDLGFREDADTPVKPGPGVVRILMTGDSNLDGVVNNPESVANALETMLNDGENADRFEVINGGVGYYGPRNYRRFLEKYIELEPDAFVVFFFSGNDFVDAAEWVAKPARRPPGYVDVLERVRELNPGALGQGLNQSYYMAQLPDRVALAQAATREQLEAIQRTCEQHGVWLLVVVWPTLVHAQPRFDAERLQAALAVLELDEQHLARTRQWVGELTAWMGERGIRHLDLFEAIRAEEQPCFWIADHHVNVHGHRRTAQWILEAHGAELAQLAEGR